LFYIKQQKQAFVLVQIWILLKFFSMNQKRDLQSLNLFFLFSFCIIWLSQETKIEEENEESCYCFLSGLSLA